MDISKLIPQRREVVVQLPSRGLPYGDLLPDGKITIHPWTTEEQLEFLQEGSNPVISLNSMMDRIVKRNTIFPEDFQYTQLLSGDRLFLLISQRAESIGDEYFVRSITCEGCGVIHTEIKVDVLDPNYITVLSEETYKKDGSDVTLPISGYVFQLKYQTLADIQSVANLVKGKPIPKEEKEKVTLLYAKAVRIKAINGEPVVPSDTIKLPELIRALDYKDNMVLDKALLAIDCGIDRKRPLDCACGTDMKYMIPFDSEFFRPKALV